LIYFLGVFANFWLFHLILRSLPPEGGSLFLCSPKEKLTKKKVRPDPCPSGALAAPGKRVREYNSERKTRACLKQEIRAFPFSASLLGCVERGFKSIFARL